MFDLFGARRRWLAILAFNAVLFTCATLVFLRFEPDSLSIQRYLPSSSKAVGNSIFDRVTLVQTETETATATVTVTTTATPRPRPSVATSDDDCDPFNEPGYFDVNKKLDETTRYVSLNPHCQTRANHIWTRLKNKEDMPEVRNKTVVLFGDSVDRELVIYMCRAAGGVVNSTMQDDHAVFWNRTDKGPPNSFPRMCTVPFHNLTMLNYFMYGLDTDGFWDDERAAFWGPYAWRERLEMCGKAFHTAGRGASPDLVFFNAGLWDLARYDLAGSRAGDSESIAYNATQLHEYDANLREYVAKLQHMFPQATLVYREPHYPRIPPTGRYNGRDKPRKFRYAAQKVEQLNQVAANVMRAADVQFWPIGQLTRGMRKKELLGDDVHPSRLGQMMIWGPGIFEYLFRNKPRVQLEQLLEPEQPKAEEQKPEEQKPEEQKPEEQKPEEQRPEEQKPEEPKAGEQKAEEPKAEEQKPEEPKVEEPKAPAAEVPDEPLRG